MRSVTAILLLASFLVLQYARQVSYWECRMSNYFKTASQQCDCEKLVKQAASQDERLPAVHHHSHLDESFYPSRILSTEGIHNAEISARCMAPHIFIGKIMLARVDRPPQIS